jgi:hypothetical protein
MQHLNNILAPVRKGVKRSMLHGSFLRCFIPAVVDICFDVTGIPKDKIEKEFPSFFDINQRGRIRKDLKCHIFLFDTEDTELFDLLSEDRDGNRKGLVKLDLKDVIQHDQK